MGWSETFLQTLKNNDVRFIAQPLHEGLGTSRGGPLDA